MSTDSNHPIATFVDSDRLISKDNVFSDRGFIDKHSTNTLSSTVSSIGPMNTHTNQQSWEVSDLATKGIKIHSFSWPVTAEVDSTLFNISIPDVLGTFQNSSYVQFMRQFARFNCAFEVGVMLNSTQFDIGLAKLVAIPVDSRRSVPESEIPNRSRTTLGIEISASKAQESRLELPPSTNLNSLSTTWSVNFRNYFKQYDLVLLVLSPLVRPPNVAQEIRGSVVLKLKNLDVQQPRPQRLVFSPLAKMLSFSEFYKEKIALARQNRCLEEEEGVCEGFFDGLLNVVNNTVSAIGSTVQSVANAVVPIAQVASAIIPGGGIAGSILNMVRSIPESRVDFAGSNSSGCVVGDGLTGGDVDPGNVPYDVNCSTITSIVNQEAVLTKISWSTTNPEDSIIAVIPASAKQQVITLGDSTETSSVTPTSYLTMFARNYRGTLYYRFKLIKNNFTTGRLRIFLVPAPSTFGNDVIERISVISHLEAYPYVIVDFSEQDEITIPVPHEGPEPLKDCSVNSLVDTTSKSNEVNGFLYVTVFTALSTNDSVANTADIVVYERGGDDFELYNPAIPLDATDVITSRDIVDPPMPEGFTQGELDDNSASTAIESCEIPATDLANDSEQSNLPTCLPGVHERIFDLAQLLVRPELVIDYSTGTDTEIDPGGVEFDINRTLSYSVVMNPNVVPQPISAVTVGTAASDHFILPEEGRRLLADPQEPVGARAYRITPPIRLEYARFDPLTQNYFSESFFHDQVSFSSNGVIALMPPYRFDPRYQLRFVRIPAGTHIDKFTSIQFAMPAQNRRPEPVAGSVRVPLFPGSSVLQRTRDYMNNILRSFAYWKGTSELIVHTSADNTNTGVVTITQSPPSMVSVLNAPELGYVPMTTVEKGFIARLRDGVQRVTLPHFINTYWNSTRPLGDSITTFDMHASNGVANVRMDTINTPTRVRIFHRLQDPVLAGWRGIAPSPDSSINQIPSAIGPDNGVVLVDGCLVTYQALQEMAFTAELFGRDIAEIFAMSRNYMYSNYLSRFRYRKDVLEADLNLFQQTRKDYESYVQKFNKDNGISVA